MSDTYEELVERVRRAEERGRSPFEFSESDTDAARLFCAAFRTQTIGLFDTVARQAADRRGEAEWLRVYRIARRLQSLGCLTVPGDVRAALGLFNLFDASIRELTEGLRDTADQELTNAVETWFAEVQAGLWVARYDQVDPWRRFKVPGLEVEIVPLVYLDHISWNVAILGPTSVGKTVHYHRCGVEIHLGFSPVQGVTILGDAAAHVEEGYAMPIPAGVPHGFDLEGSCQHRLPFIFGSAVLGGWGIFADVVPRWQQQRPLERVPLGHEAMNGSVWLERALAAVQEAPDAEPRVLIGAERTRSGRAGALELRARALQRAVRSRTTEEMACFLYHGSGRLQVGPLERRVQQGDHWGIPPGLEWTFEPAAGQVAVWLEAVLRRPEPKAG